MRPVPKLIQKLARDDDGVSIVEYALLLALIALVILGAATLLGSNISSFFSTAGSAI
jgi:pilus assembly protein Flp/PilA